MPLGVGSLGFKPRDGMVGVQTSSRSAFYGRASETVYCHTKLSSIESLETDREDMFLYPTCRDQTKNI